MPRRLRHPRCGMRRRGFAMIEVILTLLILGLAIAAFMRSFTQSLDSAKRMEVQTQAVFFAEQLMGEFEITPPQEGDETGGFGDAYKAFSWTTEVEYEEPQYGKVEGDDNIKRYAPLRRVHLEIQYDDGVHTAFTALRLDTAIVGFEKFSLQSKRSYADY